MMFAAAVVIPLSSNITHSFAASRTSKNIGYVNYDDSGFTGSSIPSANIFTDAVVGGPSPTSSPTDSVTYNGMTFTPLAKAAISTSTLAPFDTLILFEVCDIATSLTASQHTALNNYLAAGNKILLYDADRCAPSAAGNADYSWFTFPFATSNPGPQGASGTLTVVENSSLTQGLSSDPFSGDELGDANTATTSDPHWFAAAKTTNFLGNNGFFLAYARNSGLIIYDGADRWFTQGQTKSLTDLFLNELNQQYNPDNLPGTVPIASPTPTTPTPTPSPTPKPGTTITARCPNLTTIPLPPFKPGDTVKGTVTFTTTDPNEISQNEILVLTDTFTGQQFPFAPTRTPTAQPIPLIFTLTAKSSLVACIQHHDGDDTGTVTITGLISPPPPSSHPDLERIVVYVKIDGLKIPIPIALKSLESLSKKFAVASCTIGVITKEPKECIDLILKTLGKDLGVIGEGFQLLGVAVSAYACLYVPTVNVPAVALKVLACATVGVDALKELIFPGHH